MCTPACSGQQALPTVHSVKTNSKVPESLLALVQCLFVCLFNQSPQQVRSLIFNQTLVIIQCGVLSNLLSEFECCYLGKNRYTVTRAISFPSLSTRNMAAQTPQECPQSWNPMCFLSHTEKALVEQNFSIWIFLPFWQVNKRPTWCSF